MDCLTDAGMRARAAAMGLLYRKMQRLRSLKDKKIGEVSSLLPSRLPLLYFGTPPSKTTLKLKQLKRGVALGQGFIALEIGKERFLKRLA